MKTDLKERFSLADGLGAPDLWREARRRASVPEHPLTRGPSTGRAPGGRRFVTAAVAFAVFAAAAVFAWEAFDADGPSPPPVGEPPAVDLAAELPSGWSGLPPPPEVRSGSATAWTGSRLLVWGGYVFDGGGDKTPMNDGFVFDAASKTWSDLPAGPLAARARAASAWTGSELLVWGGWDGGTGLFGDGAAYDPATKTWRPLPPAPIEARAPLSVWTGTEMLVWGTAIRFPSVSMDGAAYDPTSDAWRRIAEAPVRLTDASAVWTGEEMIVFGAALDGNNRSETKTDIGAAYDPDTDTWRRIADSTLSPQAATAAWPATGEMIAWDYDQATAAYDPRTDRWRDLPRTPLRFFECSPNSVAIPGVVFGDFCGQLVTFSVTEDRWQDITREDTRNWLIEPVAAGSAFLVLAHSLDLSTEPGVTFDTRMLAYVPPTPDATGEGATPAPFVPATETVGATVRMPIVFPDGSRATLLYPEELHLAELGVQPDVSYLWSVDPAPRFPIVFLHDPAASVSVYVDGAEPIATIDGLAGRTEIWRMAPRWGSRRGLLQGAWLRYPVGSWTVLVASRTVADAYGVADYLRVRLTDDGFPVVDVVGPLELATGYGESEGPILGIADTFPDPDETPIGAAIFLSPDGCTGPGEVVRPPGGYGSDRLAGGNVFAGIYGSAAFVTAVRDGVRVENFRPA